MTARMTSTDFDLPDPGGNIVQRAKAYTRTVNALPEIFDALEARLEELEERVEALGERFQTLEGIEVALIQLQKDLAFLPQFASELDRIRPEIAEIRAQLAARLDAEVESTELVGRLLQAHDARLSALEQRPAAGGPPPRQ